MSIVRPRRMASIAVSATALLALSACGTSFGAQTNQQYDAGVGSNERATSIQVHNALFVDNGDDTATFSAGLLNKDDAAHVLTGVQASARDGAPIEAEVSGPTDLDPEVLVTTGKEGEIILTGDFPAGGFVTLSLDFEDAPSVTISAPVVARTEMYADVADKAPVDTAAQAAEQAEKEASEEEPASE